MSLNKNGICLMRLLMTKIYQNLLVKNGLNLIIKQEKITITNYKEIRIKKPMLRSDLCDFSDAYIVVRGEITATGGGNSSRENRPLAFKKNAPFIGFISKINGVQTDNVEDLDVLMPI